MRSLLFYPVCLAAPLLFTACGDAQAEVSTQSSSQAAALPEKIYARNLTAIAESANVPEVVIVTGTVQPFDRADIVPDISGKVIEVLVDRGSVVKAGDPLVRLDTRSAVLSEREARANLSSLKAQQRLADETCRRSRELLSKGAITQSEYDRDLASCNQARASVSAATARLGQADKALEDGLVRAPFAGQIAERWISVGEWASPQGRLFTLVDDHALRVDLTLSESAAVIARVGTPVTLVPVADRKRTLEANVTKLGVEIDPKSRALMVEVALPADAGLLPGMFVEARLAIGERSFPVVPRAAIADRGSTSRLFVVVGERLEERVVQLGPELGERVTVVRGLEVGESYATRVDDTTTDGTKVQ